MPATWLTYAIIQENRTVNVQNADIEPHILQIKFNQISKCPTKSYYIEFNIENESNQIEVNTTNDVIKIKLFRRLFNNNIMGM